METFFDLTTKKEYGKFLNEYKFADAFPQEYDRDNWGSSIIEEKDLRLTLEVFKVLIHAAYSTDTGVKGSIKGSYNSATYKYYVTPGTENGENYKTSVELVESIPSGFLEVQLYRTNAEDDSIYIIDRVAK